MSSRSFCVSFEAHEDDSEELYHVGMIAQGNGGVCVVLDKLATPQHDFSLPPQVMRNFTFIPNLCLISHYF